MYPCQHGFDFDVSPTLIQSERDEGLRFTDIGGFGNGDLDNDLRHGPAQFALRIQKYTEGPIIRVTPKNLLVPPAMEIEPER